MRAGSPTTLCLVALWAYAGCSVPQADGPQAAVQKYIAAVKAGDPHTTYKLLDESVRKKMTATEFAERWKALLPELKVQAEQLQERLKKPIEVTAEVNYDGGTRAQMRHRDGEWRIDAGITVAFHTATPLDALQAFIRAIDQRSYESVMKLLARSVRRSIENDIEERVKKLKTWLQKENEIEVTGDRARARYHPRYKVELVNEDGQWKVLDFD